MTKIQKNNPSEEGVALIALVAVMLVLGVVAYTFITILSTERYVEVAQHNSLKAFYLAEGAIPIGKKYYFDWYEDTDDPPGWALATSGYYQLYSDKALGDGTFDLWVDWGTGTEESNAWYQAYGSVGASGAGP